MSKPIELTEETLKRYTDLCYLESEEHFNFGKAEKKEQEQIKQQFLQIQEIVNIVKAWVLTEPISVQDNIKLTHEQLEMRRAAVYRLINLIRDKTGIDIGESS